MIQLRCLSRKNLIVLHFTALVIVSVVILLFKPLSRQEAFQISLHNDSQENEAPNASKSTKSSEKLWKSSSTTLGDINRTFARIPSKDFEERRRAIHQNVQEMWYLVNQNKTKKEIGKSLSPLTDLLR